MALRKSNRRWEDLEKANIPLKDLINYFRVFNRTEGKSHHTVEWYDKRLEIFLAWLRSAGRWAVLADLSTQTVRNYILYLQEKETKFENNPFTRVRNEKLSSHTVQVMFVPCGLSPPGFSKRVTRAKTF